MCFYLQYPLTWYFHVNYKQLKSSKQTTQIRKLDVFISDRKDCINLRIWDNLEYFPHFESYLSLVDLSWLLNNYI